MIYERKQYMAELIRKRENGRIKIITGIRRCGKSYLLFELFRSYLSESGIDDEQIIELALDEFPSAKYRNPMELDTYIRERIIDKSKTYFVMIDEIQFVKEIQNPYLDDENSKLGFIDVLLGLMKIKNVDIYVTGSNSVMLSGDILTQFRDRGDEIRVHPLSFTEFYDLYDGVEREAWTNYYTYGGMAYVQTLETHEEKSRYLRDLFQRTYLKDVLERYDILNHVGVLEVLLEMVASSIGSLTNPTKLANTFMSENKIRISPMTIAKYLGYFEEAYLLRKAKRYDVKGKRYKQSPLKYYFADVGLRNAKLGFRQQEETHIMENVLYCDLIRRGYDVDVGLVEHNTKTTDGKKMRKQLEVDFVINRAEQRYYIQSALSIAEPEKRMQEIASLIRIPDSFGKIVVVRDYIKPWRDDRGILYVGIEDFLLSEDLRF